MNKIEELIKENCPNGVEFKKLGKIGNFYGGLTGKAKDDFKNGNRAFISYKNVYNNPSLDINPTETVLIKQNEKQRTLEYGDIIFTGSSETPDECGISSVVTEEPKQELFLNSFCFFLRLNDTNILDPNFSKHLFRSHEIRYQIGKTASGVTRFNVSKEKMAEVEIPVPPLEVQREIVRVLDSFTFLSAELSAELQARKKQYEYYRDKLLVPSNEEINNCLLSDIAIIKNGKDYKHLSEGKYPVYGSGGVMKYVDQYVYDKPSVLIPRKGSLSNLFYLDEPFWNVDTVFYTEINENKVIPKYLYYLLKKEHLENLNKAGGVPSLTQTILNDVKLSIPSLDVQERIVECLDNFESICNDLNIGLPAEIEARQKQYEYYRDMLLTFAETGDIMPQTDRQTDRQTDKQ